MKKFISVFLAMIIAFSTAFSLNAFALSDKILDQIADVPDLKEMLTQSADALNETTADEDSEDESTENEPAEDEPEEEPVPEEKVETRLEKWLENMRSRNEWSLLVEGNYGPEAELFIKNGKLAILVYANGAVIEKVLYDGDEAIACSPKFPYYYYELDVDVEDSVAEITDAALQDFEGMEFVKSYEFSGFYVEEYEHAKYGLTTVYFDGEDVAYVRYTETNEIATFSYEVKDKDVKLPFFAINLTPLINYFISIYSFFLNIYMEIIFGALFG